MVDLRRPDARVAAGLEVAGGGGDVVDPGGQQRGVEEHAREPAATAPALARPDCPSVRSGRGRPSRRPDGAPPRRDSRRAEILEAFTRAVAERGYDGTNFGDLAAELGISKGTIVHHFGTKDAMLRELHEGYMRRRLARGAASSGRG